MEDSLQNEVPALDVTEARLWPEMMCMEMTGTCWIVVYS